MARLAIRSARFVRFFRHINPTTIRQTVMAARQQRLPGLASEMAYNAMLGLFPSILAVLTAIGLFEPLKRTFQTLADRVSQVAPTDALGLIENFANQLSSSRDSNLFSLSFVFALWASSGVLSAAMAALDQIHQIPPQRKRPFWKARLIALVLTIAGLGLLLVVLTIIFVSDIMVQNVAVRSGEIDRSGTLENGVLRLWQLLTWPAVLSIMSTLFAFIYRFGPSHWNHGKPILPGAILAAIFWALVSVAFRFTLQQFGSNQIYGVVGGVIVLLLWLYISSLVLLIGDQLNVTIGEAMQQSRYRAMSLDPARSTPRPTKPLD